MLNGTRLMERTSESPLIDHCVFNGSTLLFFRLFLRGFADTGNLRSEAVLARLRPIGLVDASTAFILEGLRIVLLRLRSRLYRKHAPRLPQIFLHRSIRWL